MTVVKPATEPDAKAPVATDGNASIAPLTHPAMTIDAAGSETKARGGDKPEPDLSTLTRAQLEARIKTLSNDLAMANSESDFFRKQWRDLMLRDEALGVYALTADQRKLEDNHVEAVAELYQSEMKRREALQILDKLLNSTAQLLQTAPTLDPKARGDYEVTARQAREYLEGRSGSAIPIGSSLTDGQISSINPDMNAVIVNLGKKQGVKEGMTFRVYQDKEPVASVKIVMARDLISAGPVQELKPNTVLKIGDRVVIDSE